jgi:outer membrane protein OmpA-like peptidoglycan-associated protein
MKKKVIALVSFTLLSLSTIGAQELEMTAKDSIVKSSWIFGIGTNIVDDSGDVLNNVFSPKEQWNVAPYPTRISVGRYFSNGIGLEAIGAVNKYYEGKTIDGSVMTEDVSYFSVDGRVSYDLNKIIGQTGWFDPYLGVGAGYTDANNQPRGTYNAVVGFRTWFSENWGLDLNSSGKWSMGNEATNHIQHAVGVVYQIPTEKGLSKKGAEKLAMIQEIEKENQRIQDSISAAKKAEEEARLLAERLEKERQEAERLAAEEAAKKEREEYVNKLQQELSNIGLVYFNLNSSYLNSKSKKVLDKMVEFMNTYPELHLNLASHTDARGSDEYNQWLSERRVSRTKEYLVKQGIAEERLVEKAMGETQLTNECDDNVRCTEAQHRENRRSEFTLILDGQQ